MVREREREREGGVPDNKWGYQVIARGWEYDYLQKTYNKFYKILGCGREREERKKKRERIIYGGERTKNDIKFQSTIYWSERTFAATYHGFVNE